MAALAHQQRRRIWSTRNLHPSLSDREMPLSASLKSISLVTTFTPPSPSRAWLTAPHPTLPILATAHADKTVRIYSLTSYTLLSTISGGHKRSIRTCAWKPNLKNGENVLATGSFDASVGIWRNWNINPSSHVEDREAVAIGTGEEEEDDEDWRFAIVLDGHESEVKSVAWSAGGNLLATCSRDKSVWIWEEVGEDDFETVAVLQEHEGDVKFVAWHPEEELLASASYDDEVRLWREEIDDWACVGILKGHEGTVWCVAWEGLEINVGKSIKEDGNDAEPTSANWIERRKTSGPRLLSCSDDKTIRVWRRVPHERVQQSKLSIIRSGNNEEEWVEEATLPSMHSCPIYSISWSDSGRVVSTGGDGLIVVYEEIWDPETEDTIWAVVAQVEAAHGVFEINNVAWAKGRFTSKDSEISENLAPELIISTGDDGEVKVWDLKT